MNESNPIIHVDFEAVGLKSPEARFAQELISAASGNKACTVSYIVTPPGGGSPAGLHTHEVDQIFYILSGSMSVEVDGEEFIAPPSSLVVFPRGVPHRNWNEGTEETVHLAINAPAPDPGQPFACQV